MPSPAFEQMIDRVFSDEGFAKRLREDREAAVAEYNLTDAERSALMSIGKRYGPDMQGYELDQAYQALGLARPRPGGSTPPPKPDPKTTKIIEVLKCSF